MENYRETYKEEAYELLTELEAALLELENSPDNAEPVGRVFRCMHTIKGSGAMFGFDDIADFTHEVETAYDMIRDGKIPVTKQLIDISLAACDQIRKMVNDDAASDKEKQTEIIESFRKMLQESGVGSQESEANSQTPTANSQQPSANRQPPTAISHQPIPTTYRIRFHPSPDIFSTGTNPILLISELRELGKCRVIPHIDNIPELASLEPESCYIRWDILLQTSEKIQTVQDVFIFVEDRCTLDIQTLDETDNIEDETDDKKLGEILIEHGHLTKEDLNRALAAQKRVGEILVESKAIDINALESALAEQDRVRETKKKQLEASSVSSIRVAAEKLDILVNLVGELVTVQARLTQKSSSSQSDSELHSIAEEVERLIGELRDNTMSIRMVTIGTTFNKFKRLVRDLSEELKKEAVIIIEGEDTELDKTVIEQINDPMMHIIRNTMDHGIELPEVRIAKGKPKEGIIHLSAEHSGSNVLIQISDDGAGLDTDAIRAKAVEKGMIQPDDELTEKDIFSLIFLPGFSTSEKVTEVSGRGVGLDIVKRRIESLRGSVEISSKKDIGTTTVLRLPLTLAIAEGLLVKIGEGYFIFPLSDIEECVELARKDADKARDRNMMKFRDDAVSYLSLREMFNIKDDPPLIEQVVIVKDKGDIVGLGVDYVIGQHQTVIKSLGKFYKNIKGMSGATILGDGTVALIIDIPQIIQSVKRDLF